MQVPCKFGASSAQVPCTCNAKLLHKNVQLFYIVHVPTEEFVNFILSASELHENVQHKSFAHFCAMLSQVSR